jgi:hypothetical protein
MGVNEDALAWFKETFGGKFEKPGALYKVEIPEDTDLLDWDKPLSEQPEKVREILQEYGLDRADGALQSVLREVRTLAASMESLGLEDEASELIRASEAALEDESPVDMERAIGEAGSSLDLENDDHYSVQETIWELENKIGGVSAGSFFDGMTGEEIYRNLSQARGSDKAASEFLASIGIPGHRFLDANSRDAGEGTHNYVIYDENLIEIQEKYFQGENRKPRGMFDPDTLTISLLKYADASKNADLSTFIHESGHAFLQIQFSIAEELAAELSTEPGSALSGETQFLKDTQAILDWFGVKNLDEWNALPSEEKRSYHEKFARGFEAYLFEGKAPTLEMAGIFQRFRSWLKRVYHALSNLNVELSDEVRGVFDRMLASDEEIRLAEQGRNMIPLINLENAEALGWSVERFAAYQALGKDATEEAVAKLQAKALRDMKWLRNAQGRTLEQMQKEAESARAEREIEAKREVLSPPVYIAWRYLTGTLSKEDRAALKVPKKPKSDPDTIDPANDTLFAAIGKLGGLKKDEAVSTWGTDPADKPQSGVVGKPLWRLHGEGLSIDAMSELLSQYGYLTRDENGKWDVRELEEKFAEELSGSPVYSLEHDYQPEPPRAGEQIPNPQALEAARLSLGDLEWMYNGEATEIARKKAELHDFLSGTPITEIPDNQAPIREGFAKVREWATKVFVEQGGKAVSPEIGEILLDERAVKDSQSHGRMSKARANAFLAVKDVIEQGRIVLTEPSSSDPRMESVFIAAPVKIGTIENIVTVMVHRDMNTRRMYLHAVQIRESLRVRRVSGADAVASERSGSIKNEGILNILHDLLNFKDDAPENVVVGLLKARGMVAKNGMHPDVAAELLGFSSGDDLVRQLVEARPPEEEINALTDAHLLEKYGELATPEAVQQSADAAIHNDVRARFLTTRELRRRGFRRIYGSGLGKWQCELSRSIGKRNIFNGFCKNSMLHSQHL